MTPPLAAAQAEFLAENNECGMTLLHLVSRGNAVVAELLRLSERVPAIFAKPGGLVAELLLDFSYFKISPVFEQKMDENNQLEELDEEIRETHLELLTRFFLAFESVHSYVSDLNKYIEDLEYGVYLQQNIESVFLNNDGKQLLCEALYLYGVMLLVVDAKLEGTVRERLLVAYYRYSARRSALHSDIDDICTLLRSTGYNHKTAKRPLNYPENYFRRVPLNEVYVGMVIGRLRSDDLYNQICAFPHPEQRSTALAPQAGMLYVCLYFMPEILHKQTPIMREIVDKYFPDNWVANVYMGLTINLIDAWEPYRAARNALQNSLDEENVHLMVLVDKLINLLLTTRRADGIRAKDLRTLCDASESHLRDGPTMIEPSAPLTFVGDIHGQFRDLLRIFESQGYPPRTRYLFLGDYVDRGRRGLEVIVLLMALQLKYPEQLYLLRGNHEFARANRGYGFYEEMRRRHDIGLWNRFQLVFNQMPLCARINKRIFAVHGGLSPAIENWSQLRNIERPILKAKKQGKELKLLKTGLEKFLSEGTMTKTYILENTNRLLNSLRRCNVTLRWLTLHTTILKIDSKNSKKCSQMRDVVIAESGFQSLALFDLLLSTSQFELKLKEKLKDLLAEKQETCENLRKDIADRFNELVEVYSGNKPLSRVQRNEKLQAWFADVKVQVENLTFEKELDATGRKLVQLCNRLTEVRDLHGLDTHVNVRQFLTEIQQLMQQLLRTLNIKEDTLIQIQIIGDLTYAWECIDQFTPLMQEGIKRNPDLAIKLRATFLKLSTALDLPLLRIQQASSPDLVSVSQFYSRELVLYVRRVLQVIPESVFSLLSQIVKLQTNKIKELPARLDKDKMKEFASVDERYEIARLTHAISVLTEGMLMMKTTLVGIIKVDPKQVLEDGIRRELVRQVATAMHQILAFNPKAKPSELVPKLELMATEIDGFRRSFAYISDYISLCGLRIWQEEFSRIIGYNVEQECNLFLKHNHKITDDESIHQSKVIPIPKFAPTDSSSVTFVGRLMNEILRETDFKNTVFVPSLSAWFDGKTKTERLNPQLFKLLISSIGNIGVSGVDRLSSFMIVDALQQFVLKYQVFEKPPWDGFLHGAVAVLTNEKLFDQPSKVYDSLTQKGSKLFSQFVDLISKVGQLQLLRHQFVSEVANCAKFESKLLEEAVQTLNASILTDISANVLDSVNNPYPKDENPLLYELSQYLDSSGVTDVMKKIYLCPPKMPNIACFAFLMNLWLSPKLCLVKNIGLLSKKPSDYSDGMPWVVGLVTLMQQFNPGETKTLFRYLAQYVNSFVRACLKTAPNKQPELVPEVLVVLRFATEFAYYSGMDCLSELYSVIPPTLLDQYQTCL